MLSNILKVDTEEKLQIGLKRAAEVILSGGVVAFPTESFYGLAVSVKDEEAIRRLFDLKKRRSDQPILVLVPSVELLDQIVLRVPKLARPLMSRFWPGGLTLIFEARPTLPQVLTAGTGKIGLRLSSHPVATALAEAVDMAITGTSANISGEPACSSAREVHRSLGEKVDLILDGGKTAGGKGSTLLDVTVDPPQILREGMVSREQIMECLK